MFRISRKNLTLKLVSVAIALAMWLFVSSQETAEEEFLVPVSLVNLPKNLVVTNQMVDRVHVRIKGPLILVKRAASKPRAKKVNAADMAPGDYVFQLMPSDLNLPPGVATTHVTPANFRVSLAAYSTKMVPVHPVVKGKPAKGFEVGRVTFKPDKVTIGGLTSEVGDMDWVWTRPIHVRGLKKTTTLQVQLRAPAGKRATIDHPVVTAVVEIRPASAAGAATR